MVSNIRASSREKLVPCPSDRGRRQQMPCSPVFKMWWQRRKWTRPAKSILSVVLKHSRMLGGSYVRSRNIDFFLTPRWFYYFKSSFNGARHLAQSLDGLASIRVGFPQSQFSLVPSWKFSPIIISTFEIPHPFRLMLLGFSFLLSFFLPFFLSSFFNAPSRQCSSPHKARPAWHSVNSLLCLH